MRVREVGEGAEAVKGRYPARGQQQVEDGRAQTVFQPQGGAASVQTGVVD